MRVAFFGDTHGSLKWMWEKALQFQERTRLQLDYIFQVGDLGVWPAIHRLDPATISHAERHGYSLQAALGDFQEVFLGDYEIPIPTYFIRGNHEDQEFLLALEKRLHQEHPEDYLDHAVEVCPNLHYVPDAHIITLGGVKLAGWGGCWGKKTWDLDYWSPQRAAQNKDHYARRLNHLTRDRFESLIRRDFEVLVTHDAPTGTGVGGRAEVRSAHELVDPDSITENQPEGMGVTYIRELIEEKQPRYHFCGHWHEFLLNHFGKTTSIMLDKVQPDYDPNLGWLAVDL